MRSSVGLCVLGLLCLHSSVFTQAADVHQGVLIFCDDPSVEKAVHGALHKFNEDVVFGYKLALYQIQSASKSENGSDSVYSLQFTSRRSNCPAGGSRAWTDCEYLPSRHKKPISCNATVLITETEAETQQVDCLIEDHVDKQRAPCMGCPEDIDVNSEDLRVPVIVAISKFNSISNSTHLFMLHEITHATRQVVAGFRYNIKFDMKKSVCAKEDHKELHELCVPDKENVELANCNSTVDTAPWRLESPEVMIECEPGARAFGPFSRRRPPGFTPLRNLIYTTPATLPSSPSPSSAPAKEESSEEDLTTPNPSASADPNDNLFHCPSKPWKPFQPLRDGAAEPSKAAPAAEPEATFGDADLLPSSR